jgi:hypothetical protein
VNEILRRAILGAGLDEVDVAARLEVDPKTVRRWLEGRVPYARHRWALADLLHLDEVVVWPGLRASQPRPDELLAVYPHLSSVTREMWRNFFASAKHEISILDYSSLFLAEDPGIRKIFAEKAHASVRIQIALGDPEALRPNNDALAAESDDALILYGPLCRAAGVEIRLHQIALYGSIYRADDELLCGQHVYGVPTLRSPVLHLKRSNAGNLARTYMDSFNRIWNTASH